MPKVRDASAYELYIAARKVWRSKIEWQLTNAEATRILVDVRLAAEKGDWGARALMAHFYLYGLGVLPTNRVLEPDPDKAIELVRMGVAAGQPWAYFDLGVAHEHGYGGAVPDMDIAWSYFLKAAQLGSPEAQVGLAEAYFQAGRLDLEDYMLKCALAQGHGPAAYKLGMIRSAHNQYQEATKFFHEGVKFGHMSSADSLLVFFNERYRDPDEKEAIDASGLKSDPLRTKRYDEISRALEINPDLRLTRLDEFMPLPPGTLKDWDGVMSAVEPERPGPPTY